jgi:hypothetical protein
MRLDFRLLGTPMSSDLGTGEMDFGEVGGDESMEIDDQFQEEPESVDTAAVMKMNAAVREKEKVESVITQLITKSNWKCI